MITAKTKKQLIAFVILTLVGVTFVGGRYARLDKLFYDSTYTVDVKYDQSGGIFAGAGVLGLSGEADPRAAAAKIETEDAEALGPQF